MIDGIKSSQAVTGDVSVNHAPAERWLADEFPVPTFGGDPVAGALAAIAKFSEASREMSQKLREQKDAVRAKKDAEEVNAMRQKAEAIYEGALGSAAMLGVSAGFSAASCASSANASPSASSPGSATASSAAAGQGGGTRLLDDGSAIFRAGSDIPNKMGEAAAIEHDADARAAASAAKTAQTESDSHSQNASASDEVARKARDAIKTILEMRHSTELAILNKLA
jgi:hypothetical protein